MQKFKAPTIIYRGRFALSCILKTKFIKEFLVILLSLIVIGGFIQSIIYNLFYGQNPTFDKCVTARVVIFSVVITIAVAIETIKRQAENSSTK